MSGSYATYRGEKKCIGFWCGYPRERRHLEDLGVESRVIVKSVLKESVGKWIYLAQVAGLYECVNEHLGSMKCGNFWSRWGPVCFSRRTVLHGVI